MEKKRYYPSFESVFDSVKNRISPVENTAIQPTNAAQLTPTQNISAQLANAVQLTPTQNTSAQLTPTQNTSAQLTNATAPYKSRAKFALAEYIKQNPTYEEFVKCMPFISIYVRTCDSAPEIASLVMFIRDNVEKDANNQLDAKWKEIHKELFDNTRYEAKDELYATMPYYERKKIIKRFRDSQRYFVTNLANSKVPQHRVGDFVGADDKSGIKRLAKVLSVMRYKSQILYMIEYLGYGSMYNIVKASDIEVYNPRKHCINVPRISNKLNAIDIDAELEKINLNIPDVLDEFARVEEIKGHQLTEAEKKSIEDQLMLQTRSSSNIKDETKPADDENKPVDETPNYFC